MHFPRFKAYNPSGMESNIHRVPLKVCIWQTIIKYAHGAFLLSCKISINLTNFVKMLNEISPNVPLLLISSFCQLSETLLSKKCLFTCIVCQQVCKTCPFRHIRQLCETLLANLSIHSYMVLSTELTM